MKKLIKTSFSYGIAAMAAGVFFREFTKFISFDGRTSLGFMHPHLFMLGAALFLILALFAERSDLCEQKHFKRFYRLYNIGLPFMVVMMCLRGVLQVLSVPLSGGASAAISGIAGIAHIITGVGLIFMFLALLQMQPRKGEPTAR